jgi:ribosomal protein S27E
MEDFAMKFRCTHCGHKISVSKGYAGKNAKCPKCGNFIVIPKTGEAEPSTDLSSLSDSKGGTKYAGFDLALFDIPPEDATANQLSSQESVSEKVLEELQRPVGKSATGETEPVDDRKLPWIIDIFLYPISMAGLANLAIFIGVPLLMDFLQKIMIIQLSCLFWLVSMVIKVVVVLYMYWYFAECVRDSADGGLRAPKVIGSVPRVVDMFGQMVNIIGCLAIFFAPVVLYLWIAKRADIIFWLLLIPAVFVFPMALLAVVVFDSAAGFNPRLIYNSISNTFRQYSGLVLSFVAAILLIGVLGQKVGGSGHSAFFISCAATYLIFVAAHLLGRFYWRHQEKLNWKLAGS